MNSMFSCFDALCAEFLLGQKVRSSFVSTNNMQSQNKSKPAVTDNMAKEKQEANPSPQKQRRATRFAPELDGLNCFETLVSY